VKEVITDNGGAVAAITSLRPVAISVCVIHLFYEALPARPTEWMLS
jgi:hypothetical protein